MGILIIVAIISAGLFFGGNYLNMKDNKELYRVKVIDRLNGSQKYLSFVDGINDTFSLSKDRNSSICYSDLRDALYIKDRFEHENAQFVIEKKIYSIWGSDWAVYLSKEIENINKS